MKERFLVQIVTLLELMRACFLVRYCIFSRVPLFGMRCSLSKPTKPDDARSLNTAGVGSTTREAKKALINVINVKNFTIRRAEVRRLRVLFRDMWPGSHAKMLSATYILARTRNRLQTAFQKARRQTFYLNSQRPFVQPHQLRCRPFFC